MHHILKSIQGVNNQLILGSWLLIFILVCLCFSTPVSADSTLVYKFNKAPDNAESCAGVVLSGPSLSRGGESDVFLDCYDDIEKYISLRDAGGNLQVIERGKYIFLERTLSKFTGGFGDKGCGHVIAVNQSAFTGTTPSSQEADLIYWDESCKDGALYYGVSQADRDLLITTVRIIPAANQFNLTPSYSLNILPQNNSCRNVILWGSGGDNLKSAPKPWFCYDDFHQVNNAAVLTALPAGDSEHFQDYDSLDSSELGDARDARNHYYIFIEQRDNACGNRILIHKDEFENNTTSQIRGIAQDNKADPTSGCRRYRYNSGGLAVVNIKVPPERLNAIQYVMESASVKQILDNETCDYTVFSGLGGDRLDTRGSTWECIDEDDDSDPRRTTPYQSPNNSHNPPLDTNAFYVFTEYRDVFDKCGSRILINKNSFSAAIDKGFVFGIWQDWDDDCDKGPANTSRKSTLVTIGLESPPSDSTDPPNNLASPSDSTASPSNLAPLQGNSSSSNPAPQNCEVLAGWLSWTICPLLEAATGILNWAETQAIDSLRIDSSKYNQPANQPAVDNDPHYLYELWSTMRDFVTYAIIGTALFMIISTAFDIGVFKNYTVKKYLPKLVAGTIFIQFSWILGDLMIQGFTQLGDLVASIIYGIAPTELRGWGLDKILGGGGIETDGLSIIAVGGAVWGWVLLLPVMFTLAIGLFIAYLFLVFRKILIIALLVFGPIGLALWILPGNDRAWRFYFKTFFYLLLLYPVIVTIIAFGKFFSWLIIQTDW
ncbi:MAG: hypothetical protein OXF85_01870 [Candidatus Saccharibacteria bacterium]|nr:hypothetical protein [Candidatus Saccharibacteria bacterium]